jgi:hypothetical protein
VKFAVVKAIRSVRFVVRSVVKAFRSVRSARSGVKAIRSVRSGVVATRSVRYVAAKKVVKIVSVTYFGFAGEFARRPT